MPVKLTLTVPDLPDPPKGYLVVAVEVRDREPSERLPPDRGLFPITTKGYESAARLFFDRSHTACGLACIAWFADKPLTDCEDGKERIVSRFDADSQEWSEWVPEAVVTPRVVATTARERVSGRGFRKLAKLGPGEKDVGEDVEPEQRGEAA